VPEVQRRGGPDKLIMGRLFLIVRFSCRFKKDFYLAFHVEFNFLPTHTGHTHFYYVHVFHYHFRAIVKKSIVFAKASSWGMLESTYLQARWLTNGSGCIDSKKCDSTDDGVGSFLNVPIGNVDMKETRIT
jgi:hypothetical protein